MIEITPGAATQIKTMLSDKKMSLREGGLRIFVENGGCSGRQYIVSFDAQKADDQVFHQHDVNIFIDPSSLAFIDGSTIDYKDGLTGAGFKIRNPNAKQTCGCGTSFET